MEVKLTRANGLIIGCNTVIMIIVTVMGLDVVESIYEFGVMEWQSILQDGEYYRLLTSMFLHFGFDHYFQNMVFLFIVGCYLEEALGSIRYLIFYLLSGLGAGICSLIVDATMEYNVVSAGASGAIFGVVGGLLCVIIKNRGRYEGLGFGGMIFMVAASLYYGFTSTDVDNVAHIGGFICGFLLGFLFYRKRREGNLEGRENQMEGTSF